MIDREKVLKGLERLRLASECDHRTVDGYATADLCNDTLELLKAQWFDNLGELIRCKDCKFWNRDDPAGNGCECHCNGGWWLPEDYCSCGERRDSDE